jgi:hypothetical protein
MPIMLMLVSLLGAWMDWIQDDTFYLVTIVVVVGSDLKRTLIKALLERG